MRVLLVLIVILKDLGIAGALRLCNATLHRKWRSWLNGRFNGALLDANHTHFHVQHGGRGQDGRDIPPPDNIDQRVHESIKDMTGGAIGLASGAFGAVSALVIYGYELVKMSSRSPASRSLAITASRSWLSPLSRSTYRSTPMSP